MTLAELRATTHLTQRDVAHRMNLTQAAICRIETQGRTSITTLERYAAAIGKTAEQVLAAARTTRERSEGKTHGDNS